MRFFSASRPHEVLCGCRQDQLCELLPAIARFARAAGLIFIDNVLWDGDVLKQLVPVERTATIQALD
jgi:predicted O-methyltransferase YrrM